MGFFFSLRPGSTRKYFGLFSSLRPGSTRKYFGFFFSLRPGSTRKYFGLFLAYGPGIRENILGRQRDIVRSRCAFNSMTMMAFYHVPRPPIGDI